MRGRSLHIVMLAILFGILFWILDAALDSALYSSDSFVNLLLLRVPMHELTARLFVLFGFLVLGAIASLYQRRTIRSLSRMEEHRLRYQTLFEDSPLPMWEDDWSDVKSYFDELRASGVTDFGAFLAQHPEAVEHCIALVRVIDVNRASVEMHEMAGKNALLEGLDDIFGEHARRTFRDELIALASGKTNFTAETIHVTATGRPIDVELTVHVAAGHENDLRRVFVSTLPITDRKAAERALRESEETYRDLFENASDLIQSVTPEGKFRYVNRAWLKTLGYTQKDLVDLSLSDVLDPDSRLHCGEILQKVLAGEDVGRVEAKFVTREGHAIDVEGRVGRRVEDGIPTSTRGIFRNVTERKAYERELKRLARHDSLTGVYNRHTMHEVLAQEEQRARRYGHSLGLLMIDVNRFKEINDRFGHLLGDRVLQAIAELLRAEVRATDYVFRYGGDEFVVVCLEPSEETETVRTRIEAAVDRRNRTNELIDFPVTLAIGTTYWDPSHEKSIEELLGLADERMYADKRGATPPDRYEDVFGPVQDVD